MSLNPLLGMPGTELSLVVPSLGDVPDVEDPLLGVSSKEICLATVYSNNSHLASNYLTKRQPVEKTKRRWDGWGGGGEHRRSPLVSFTFFFSRIVLRLSGCLPSCHPMWLIHGVATPADESRLQNNREWDLDLSGGRSQKNVTAFGLNPDCVHTNPDTAAGWR